MDVEDISLAILVVKDHGREGSTEVEVEQMARKSKSGKKEQGLGHLSQKKQSSEAGAAAGYRDRVADAEREDLVPVVVIGRGKKRKRTSDEEAQAEGQQKASEEENLKERKQSRRVDVREGGVGDGERESVNNKQKERFILFVGKYITGEGFSHCLGRNLMYIKATLNIPLPSMLSPLISVNAVSKSLLELLLVLD